MVDDRTGATHDVLWHAERGEGRLRPWRRGADGEGAAGDGDQ